MVDPSWEVAVAAAPVVVFVFSGPVGLFLGWLAVVGWVATIVLSPTSNPSASNQPQTQANTGAGQTNQGSVAQTQTQAATSSPPPSGRWPKRDDKWKTNDTNKSTSKDFDRMAKDQWLKETKEFGRKNGEKVYKNWSKYYSGDNTLHNWGVWKVFKRVGNYLRRIGTADKNLNIFKK